MRLFHGRLLFADIDACEREKGTQAAAGSVSRGSQTGLGSLFPFTDSSSHRQQHTDNFISLTTGGVSKMCSQV